MSEEFPKLASSPFVTCDLYTPTADDIKLPTEADAEYFRKLANEPNPIALSWKCLSHPPTTTECVHAVNEIKSLGDVSMGSWWLDDKGFVHFLVWATKKDKDGAIECRPNALRRPAKPILQSLFNIKPNQATHQSVRRDEIRARGGFELDPETGAVVPLAPSQLLVPQPHPSAAAATSAMEEDADGATGSGQVGTKKSDSALDHLGLPPAPRVPPTPKQAASNPPAPAAVAERCKDVIHASIEAEADTFSALFAKVLAKVQAKQPVNGLAKTKSLRDETLQVLDKTQLVLPFATALTRISRFAMNMLCSVPNVKIDTNGGQFLMRPDAEPLLDLWPRYTANATSARKIVRGDRPESGVIESKPTTISLDPSPLPQDPPMSKSSAKPTSSSLPSVANKNKPAPPAAAAAAAAAAASTSSSGGDDFLSQLARDISPSQLKGNFYYEGGRCFADRARNKPAVHSKLIGMAKECLSGTGMFDPTSAQMKSAADVRAAQLPSRSSTWESGPDNAFVMFSMVPALLAVKGFLDNGVSEDTAAMLDKLQKEAAEMGKERAKLESELNKAKRRNEELEEELEEARKAPKADPLSAPADI